MPRIGSSPFSFPDFRGATRRLVLINLFAYFALLVAPLLLPHLEVPLTDRFGFAPSYFLHGWFWQPFTYSLLHPTLLGAAFDAGDADKAQELAEQVRTDGPSAWKLQTTLDDCKTSSGLYEEPRRGELLKIVAMLEEMLPPL